MDSLKCGTVDNPNVSAANRANRTNNTPQLVQITQSALFATAEIGWTSTTLVVITLKSADMFHQMHINGQHANTQIQAHKRKENFSSSWKWDKTNYFWKLDQFAWERSANWSWFLDSNELGITRDENCFFLGSRAIHIGMNKFCKTTICVQIVKDIVRWLSSTLLPDFRAFSGQGWESSQ